MKETKDDRIRWLALVAVACTVVFGLGLVVGWLDGVRLDRLVVAVLSWLLLLALCGSMAWAVKRSA
jgi:hypothetical protein